MRRTIVGIMGPGEGASAADCERAYALGEGVAQRGWVLLTGGRPQGVMAAANRGARAAGGLTVGVLPDGDADAAAPEVAVAIATDLGNARNNINVLSSDAIVACGMGLGTASEVALALKAGKPVVLLAAPPEALALFRQLAGERVASADTPEAALQQLPAWLAIPDQGTGGRTGGG